MEGNQQHGLDLRSARTVALGGQRTEDGDTEDRGQRTEDRLFRTDDAGAVRV